MKIAQSQVDLTASYRAEKRLEQRETLNIWKSGADTPGNQRQPALNSPAARVSLSQKAIDTQPERVQTELTNTEPAPSTEKTRLALFKAIIERLLGRKLEVFDPAELSQQDDSSAITTPSATSGNSRVQGWGISYDYYESYYESEQVEFNAEAVIQTSDGREIAASVNLNMSREFFQEQRISLRAGDALKDPLIVNFSGQAAELTQRDFQFDLDLDGQEDQIAFVAPGSGFLALDNNGDGKINDGSELFGPRTGSGFKELASYDEDGNGWIDEQDSVYDRLRIWSRSDDGQMQLIGLGARGVGAIYLGSLTTPFELNNSSNETLGKIRETGIYLDEDGKAGTLQQLDLVI